MEVRHYVTSDGSDPFQDWLDGLRDLRARVAILRRIDRVAAGNLGDRKHLRDGVWELRIDFEPGYRIYYALTGKVVVLLLCAGSKRTQNQDIARAAQYWFDFRDRQR